MSIKTESFEFDNSNRGTKIRGSPSVNFDHGESLIQELLQEDFIG